MLYWVETERQDIFIFLVLKRVGFHRTERKAIECVVWVDSGIEAVGTAHAKQLFVLRLLSYYHTFILTLNCGRYICPKMNILISDYSSRD